MHILITALGSAGDVFPFLAIGRTLQARGHAVRLLSSSKFEAEVAAAGLAFTSLGSTDDYERLIRRPGVWRPLGGMWVLLEGLLEHLPTMLRTTAAAVDAAGDPRQVLLVGSTLAWNMRLLQEQRGLRAVSVHLSPSCIASALQPPMLPGVGDLGGLPVWLRRALQRASEALLVDPFIARRLDPIRAALGLPRARRLLSRWLHSPDAVVCAWPAWFAPAQADWPAQAATTGFPIHAPPGDAPLPAELEAFLADGPPPVALTPGSAMTEGRRFFERGLAACSIAGRRALLVTPFADQLPPALPGWARQVAFAPFGRLFPRLAGVIHHGGIGTCAQGLQAGISQVIVPFAFDQFDNAARLARLQAGARVRLADAPERWAAALIAQQAEGPVRARAAAAARQADRQAALDHIAKRIEAAGRA